MQQAAVGYYPQEEGEGGEGEPPHPLSPSMISLMPTKFEVIVKVWRGGGGKGGGRRRGRVRMVIDKLALYLFFSFSFFFLDNRRDEYSTPRSM